MQEVRRLKPSTVSRRTSIVAGFYRTAVIDGLLEHSPAEHVRRPHVPADSPTLGLTPPATRSLTHRRPAGAQPVRLRAGLPPGSTRPADLRSHRREHRRPRRGTRPPRPSVAGKGGKTILVPLPPAVGRALDAAIGDRAAGPILLNRRGARMDRHAATRRLRALAQAPRMRMPPLHPHMLRHTSVTTMLDAGVDLRDVQIAARHADPRTTMRYDRARNQLDRHPNYILAAYMASGT